MRHKARTGAINPDHIWADVVQEVRRGSDDVDASRAYRRAAKETGTGVQGERATVGGAGGGHADRRDRSSCRSGCQGKPAGTFQVCDGIDRFDN